MKDNKRMMTTDTYKKLSALSVVWGLSFLGMLLTAEACNTVFYLSVAAFILTGRCLGKSKEVPRKGSK